MGLAPTEPFPDEPAAEGSTSGWTDPIDGRVHRYVIASFIERGHAPSVARLSSDLDQPASVIESALERLHRGHGLVLHPGRHAIWIAHPFSSTPTNVWVEAAAAGWWAPCLWCGLGVGALVATDVVIHTRLAGEHEAVRIDVREGEVVDAALLVHFCTPPRDAWNNVSAWCASVQPFVSAEQIDMWCERHALQRGEAVPIDRVQCLARAWYGRHLDPDWRKWTVAEAQAIFGSVGLRGDFWRLPSTDRPF